MEHPKNSITPHNSENTSPNKKLSEMTPGELRKRGLLGRGACGYPCESRYDPESGSATYTIGRDT